MISRRPFYAALVMSFFACSDSPNYVPPTNEPVKAPLPNDCVNPTVRYELGTMETGMKTIRIRARIAQNSLGAVALKDETQIVNDLHVLNTRFESSNLRFLLDDVELLAKDDADADAVYEATSNPLCKEAFKPLAEDSIPVLYVGNLVLPSGQARGTGNACGAVINARITDSEFGNLAGPFSDIEAVPRMMGYVLGLLRTHACYNIPGYENDPQLSGDLVGDTTFDPGSANELLTCGGTTAPGKCIFLDEAACEIQCADSSMPDVHNIMSSYVGCRERFSEGQSVYMRCAVELHHSQAKCDNVWANDFGKGWDNKSYYTPNVHLADVDGDGRADAILHDYSTTPSTWRVALSTDSQFGMESTWKVGFGDEFNEYQEEMIADVNGDKKADVVIQDKGEWHVAKSTGSSFGASKIWLSGHPGESMLGDVDGDGKADAVGHNWDGERWSVALSTGSAFATPTVWIEGFGTNWTNSKKVGDVDGDSKADAIVFSADETPGFGTVCKWEVARSTGSAFAPAETWYEEKCADVFRWYLDDVDGDKKLDLVVFNHHLSSWYVHLSTGTSFGSPQFAMAGLGHGIDRLFVADVDGNKKADFVTFDTVRGIWATNICRSDGSSN